MKYSDWPLEHFSQSLCSIISRAKPRTTSRRKNIELPSNLPQTQNKPRGTSKAGTPVVLESTLHSIQGVPLTNHRQAAVENGQLRQSSVLLVLLCFCSCLLSVLPTVTVLKKTRLCFILCENKTGRSSM